MKVFYCDECGMRLADADLESGRAVQIEAGVFCRDCATAGGISPQQPQAVPQRTRRPVSASSARAARQPVPGAVFPRPAHGTPKWLFLSLAAIAVLIVLIIAVLKLTSHENAIATSPPAADKEPTPPAPADTASPTPEQPPVVPTPEPAPQPLAAPKEPAFRFAPRPAVPRPDKALVLFDFDDVDCPNRQVAAPHATGTLRIDGDHLLAVTKAEGDSDQYASVRLAFPEPLDLTGLGRISFHAASGPVEAGLRFGIESGGRVMYLTTPQADTQVSAGPAWQKHVFLLAGDLKKVVALVVGFNLAAEKRPFIVGLDEFLALQRVESAVAPAQPASTQPAPSSGPPQQPETPEPPKTADAQAQAQPESAAATKPPQPPPDLRNTSVLLYADFDKDTSGFVVGRRITANTFNNSPGSFQADCDLEDQWNSCKVRTDARAQGIKGRSGIFQVGPDTRITFAYYLDEHEYIFLNCWSGKREISFQVPIKVTRQRRWTIHQIHLLGIDQRKPPERCLREGDWIDMLTFVTGSARKQTTFILDNVLVHNGEMPTDVGAALAAKIAETKLLSPDLKRDGYFLSEDVLANLKSTFRSDGASPSSIAILGDYLADSSFLLKPLMSEQLAGRSLLSRTIFTSRRKDLDGLYDRLERNIKRNRPEVMLVFAGYTDLTRKGVPSTQLEAAFRRIVDKLITSGTCPVLVTLPRHAALRDSLTPRFIACNQALLKMASDRRIPAIEATLLINRDEKPGTYFQSSGRLKRPAYDLINAAFFNIYRAIEYKVFERGGPLVDPNAKAAPQHPPAEPEPETDPKIDNIEI